MASSSQKLRAPSSWAKHKRNFDENDSRRERRAAKRLCHDDNEYPDNTRDQFSRWENNGF
jgi:hypothetical protein